MTWREDLDPERIDGREVADVVRDDRRALSSDSELGNHVVLWIGQQWSPEEEDSLAVRKQTNGIDEVANTLRLEGARDVSKQDVLVLKDERYGGGDLEIAALEVAQQSV